MKIWFFVKSALWLLAASLFAVLTACEDVPLPSAYCLVLPELPEHWGEILAEPHWRLEWAGPGGIWHEREIPPGQMPPDIALMPEWSSPALAWPFWPERGLVPGMMRPAGAVFPWDARGGKLAITWRGGVDALFWKELALAERTSDAAERRLPWYFDWPRFRELLQSEHISEAVREDPWLADWKSIAGRTVQSGFDRRRIASRSFTELAVPSLDGRWIGSSPFALPLDAPPHLNVTAVVDIWVSPSGILKASASGWVLHEN